MRRKGLWIAAMAAMVGMSLVAHADTAGVDGDPLGLVTGINFGDGNLSDWGVTLPGNQIDYTGSVWTPSGNNAQGAYVYEDSVGSSGFVGPLYGNQDFDAEALYTGYDAINNTLHVALVTGFNLNGENGGFATGWPFSAGDIFIDFGTAIQQNGRVDDPNTVGNDQNADVASTLGNSVNYTDAGHTWDLAFVLNRAATVTNGTTGNITSNAVTGFGIDYSPTPNDAGVNSGPLAAIGGTLVGTSDFRYTQGINGGNRNLYEFSYAFGNDLLHDSWRDMLVENGSGNYGWTVHWTMSCGNDYLDAAAYLDDTTNFTPLVPVPAAAPLGMLGMGLLALVRRVRRRTEC